MKLDKTEIRKLESWLTIPEAADIVGCSRENIHQALDDRKFPINALRFVGAKKIILISEQAVKDYKTLKETGTIQRLN